MAMAFRPRPSPCSIRSRYGSQALVARWLPIVGEIGWPKSVVTSMAGFDGSGSVVTPMAGFDGARCPHPGRHTTTPADLRYALAVSLRTPVTCSMRRKGHPSFPSAMTCCFFSSLKTLLMPKEPIRAPLGVNVPGFTMAGFQLTLYGRIWVTPEDSPEGDKPFRVARYLGQSSIVVG